MFSWAILGKKLSITQWISLVVLMVGVSLAQLSASDLKKARAEMNTTAGFVAGYSSNLCALL